MKATGKIFITGIAALLTAAGALKAGERKSAVVVRSESGDPIATIPVSDETVIKFEGDTLRARIGEWETAVAKTEMQGMTHEDLRTSLEVAVALDNRPDFPMADVYVALEGAALDYYALVQLTDTAGVATFRNIPAGVYDVVVQDREREFFTREIGHIVHCSDTRIATTLVEEMLMPVEAECVVEDRSDDYYSVALKWLMDEDNPTAGPFRTYTFTVYLDGEPVGETRDTGFRLTGLKSREYHVAGLAVRSEYGNEGDGILEIPILANDFVMTSTGTIVEEEADAEYFTLGGLPVREDKLGQGVYICRKGGRVVKWIRN